MTKIILDAGHGGGDPGASGGGLLEKDINLEATLYVGERLEKLGFQVNYTRTLDVDPGNEYARGLMAKDHDFFLSLHCNAFNKSAFGSEVYTNCREKYASTELNLRDGLGALFTWRGIKSRRYLDGKDVHRNVNSSRQFSEIIDSMDWFGVLRGCWAVGVSGNLLEMFFIDNESDRKKFLADRWAVYEGIVKALCSSFGVEYTPLGAEPIKPITPPSEGVDYVAEYKKLLANNEELHKRVHKLEEENKFLHERTLRYLSDGQRVKDLAKQIFEVMEV